MATNNIIRRIRAECYRVRHRLMVRTVLKTPPLAPGSLSGAVLATVGRKDLLT